MQANTRGEAMSVPYDFETAWRSLPDLQLPLLLCLFTGSERPDFCSPMPRDPSPSTGANFDSNFIDRYIEAIVQNPSIHDGAILIGRQTYQANYHVEGWSIRLHPPAYELMGVPNRGSAFNSCLAMSCVPRVDAMYLVSARRLFRFISGDWAEISA